MGLGELAEKVMSLIESFTVIKDRQKQQNDEILALRRQNEELIRQNTAVVERLARLEEGRNTMIAEIKVKMTETISAWEMQKMREELDALKRKKISDE